MKAIHRIALAMGLSLAATAAGAQVTVDNAWVRATVPGQHATGAFMTLRSPTPARLVSAQSDIAATTEIHEMAMQGDVMRMRQINGLDLPAGQDVALKPGGYHLMLLDLKHQAQAGKQVAISLVFDVGGKRQTVQVHAPIQPLAGGAPQPHAGHGMPSHQQGAR
ncbi:copper chaperone PCu(A)C [Bordetella petrii]|uniref:copper chaperone PCu(A)C n=1 Tax=Bordetella petrii TaxID=94624 RepID=UPI001E36FD4E|nr:copper chaperone PCu(A)C [Bordetella petrii]MCD0506106.1 copper chaperone PCu(A)C [Bordetella petrii]